MRWLSCSMGLLIVVASGCGGSGDDLFGGNTQGAAAGATQGAGGSPTSSSASTGSSVGGAGGSGGSCASVPWYCDADADNHGDPTASIAACEMPPGNDATCGGSYVASNDDCAPKDANAHPEQTQFFDVAVQSPVSTPPFDYDCNGVEERDPSQLFKMTGMAACTAGDCGLNPPQGFTADAPCGQKTNYVRCEFDLMVFQCTPKPQSAPDLLRCR